MHIHNKDAKTLQKFDVFFRKGAQMTILHKGADDLFPAVSTILQSFLIVPSVLCNKKQSFKFLNTVLPYKS